MENVVISGAGPAGLSAAITLANAGYDVEVFEKNMDVGKRFHGTLQGLENWSKKKDALKKLKQMDFAVNFDHYPFLELTISNGKKRWDFLCNKPAFYLVKRGSMTGSLDQGLKQQALNSGVNIRFGETLTENQADIVATGPLKTGKFAAAKGIVFKTELENMVIALVNNKAAIKGYSYLLVADGQATMCSVLFDGFENLVKCFNETQNIFSKLIDLDIQNPQVMGGIGCFSNKNTFKANGRLYISEAAGLQDLLWGFGIKSAITSGFLAAKSIIDNEDYAKIASTYFDEKLKASIVNRFLWEKFAVRNYSFIVNQIHNAKDPLKYLNSFHNFNILQRLIYPFALRSMRKRYKNLRL